MSCVAVLCMILFVSQVEMLPVSQVTAGQTSELLTVTKTSFEVQTMDKVDQMDLLRIENYKPESALPVAVLSRVERSAITHHRCPRGLVKLWKHCVTCKQYMKRKETDECPKNTG